ncbi:MAG: DeoR/GlpR transcriptional regulator, partial [Deltaproteobacteria bacterium]|nr:DeoR/GlpR transcriptional regulator [Deltaproteobacteria bacterium]
DRRDLPFGVRETVNLAEKRAIAQHAVQHIADGDVIALDASSTARELARLIPDIPLTVVTNSIAVVSALVDRVRVRVISTGGVLDAPSLSYIGPLAEQALGRFHIKKLFLSCQGIDLERGLSVTADEHAGIKRRMIELAERTFLLVDHSKIGVKAVEFFAPVADVDVVLTDSGIDPEFRRTLQELGITVEIAGPEN